MARKNSGKNICSGGEKTLICRRCHTKFPVKLGNKNNGSHRRMRCPECKFENIFRVDEKGRLHGPV